MTISTTTTLNRYTGNAATTVFPYTFRILAATDLVVTKLASGTLVPVVLSYPADYSVSGVGNATGGSITMTVAPATGDLLVIQRVMTVTQPTSIRNNGSYFADTHENVFDRQTMVDQQHDEALGRSLHLPVTLTGVSPAVPSPIATYTLGWDATGTNLINIAQGGRGPAGVGGPIPIFADATARNAFYPTPAVDNASWTKSTGRFERYGVPTTGANKWLPTGVTREAGTIVDDAALGAYCDGATDDSSFLSAMDAAVVANGGHAEMSSGIGTGVRFVNTNLTLNAKLLKVYNGSKFYVAVGKTLTINCDIDAGEYPIFDPTMPGSVVINSPRATKASWFGIKGNNVVDDKPAMAFMEAVVGAYAVTEFARTMTINLASMATVQSQRGRVLRGLGATFPDGGLCTRFTWSGGAGGTMIKFSSCDSPIVENIYFDLGSRGAANNYATVGVDLDDSLVNGVTGTAAHFYNCRFSGTNMPRGIVHYYSRVSNTSLQNQEYNTWIGCRFYGTGFMAGPTQGLSATILGGSLGVLTINGEHDIAVGQVYRVQVIMAGAGGGVLDTNWTITSVNAGANTMTGTLAVAATAAVAGVFVLLGQADGQGITIGPSSNAKGQFFHGCQFVNLNYGYYQGNGSGFSLKNNYSIVATCIDLENGSESFESRFDNTEQSWQFLYLGLNGNGGLPVTVSSGRFGNFHMKPNAGYFRLNGGSPVVVEHCEFDNAPIAGTGSTAYDFSTLNGRFLGLANRYAGGWTPQQVGYLVVDTVAGVAANTLIPAGSNTTPIESRHETGITGATAQMCMYGCTMYYTCADAAPTMLVEVRTGGATLAKHIALMARAMVGSHSNGSDILTAIQGTFAKEPGGGIRADRKWRAVEAAPALATDGYTALEITGFHAETPIITGGGANPPVNGMLIEDQQAGGGSVGTSTNGIKQLGLSDPNLFNGLTSFGTGRVVKATVYIDIGAGGTATPNPAGASSYRYRIAGAATINVPINPLDGMEFEMEIFNNTGGAITPTLNGIFLGTGYGSIGAGKSRTRRWQYDGNLTKWKPIGAVSEDF